MTGYDAQGNFLPPQQLVDEIERLQAEVKKYKDWCRKLIEAGKFPGEIGNPLN